MPRSCLSGNFHQPVRTANDELAGAPRVHDPLLVPGRKRAAHRVQRRCRHLRKVLPRQGKGNLDPVFRAPPRLPRGEGPTIPAGGAIPGDPELLPETMSYDPATRRLSIGLGYVENVPKEVWEYEVSGKNVLRQWFSYRKRDRSRPVIGDRRPPSPLENIQPDHWLAEYTSDLLDLLHVLGRLVRLEARQADLLARICDGPLLSADELEAAGAFALPKTASQKGKKGTKSSAGQDDLFQA